MVIITDMVMPGLDGLEFCKASKKDQNTPHIPVIILTSHDNEEGKLSGYYAVADIYLTEPRTERNFIANPVQYPVKQKTPA